MPKVSVLMPTFNNLLFLKDSIESILSQSFKDFEFIIIDDGSTDGSDSLLEKYAQRDRRIRIVKNEKNMGIVFSLNRGIKECCGDYIARMDSDDIAINNRLEKQVAAMEADSDISVLGGALSYIDSRGRDLDIIRYCKTSGSILSRTPLLHPTVMIRKETLVQNKIYYQEKYHFAEDYFLWLQISRIGKISAINDVVVKYRLSAKATRIRHLKGVLWATFKAKKDAIILLDIKPTLKDIAIIIIEIILLMLPSSIVLWLYFRMNFGQHQKIRL